MAARRLARRPRSPRCHRRRGVDLRCRVSKIECARRRRLRLVLCVRCGPNAQLRTPITDGSGKPWVFRYKDILSWWSNPHHNRPGGAESADATAWVPQSKPFWFMEFGCPAVDKGANQPNVFVDPKSSESMLPYYSRGIRDDLMQARFLQVFRDAFDWTKSGYIAGLNPISTVRRRICPRRRRCATYRAPMSIRRPSPRRAA
ncbi:MAG TPA: glycoside hydrolase TIM-barrel-like domain-containing protein [Hyphomicrobium sp.]